MNEEQRQAWPQYRDYLIMGLFERLGRYARGPMPQRRFIVEELTHVLSETNSEWRQGD